MGISALPADRQPSREYAAQANDAIDALARAAQAAYNPQHREIADINRSGVLLALENLEPVNGSSGVIKLHGEPKGHYASDRPILLVTADRNGAQQLIRQCGKLYQEQQTKC